MSEFQNLVISEASSTEIFSSYMNNTQSLYTVLYSNLLGFHHMQQNIELYKRNAGDFPGGPVTKTLCFNCRGHGFN